MKKLLFVVMIATLFTGCDSNDPAAYLNRRYDEGEHGYNVLMQAGHIPHYDPRSGKKWHSPSQCMKCTVEKALKNK